eukprot:c13175_g1_i4.p1 GENE.c13175_g1_i4~~c13175_g1_i4.p1  ORF type:complete len:149 (-),score=28.20 c13175_g1_i4:50-496(-)
MDEGMKDMYEGMKDRDEVMKDRDEGMKGKEETNKILFLLRSFELGFSLNIVSWHGGEGIECEQNLSIEVKRNFWNVCLFERHKSASRSKQTQFCVVKPKRKPTKLFQWFAREGREYVKQRTRENFGNLSANISHINFQVHANTLHQQC